MTNEINEVGWNIDNSYAELSESFYTHINPTPVPEPKIVAFNNPLATALGLKPEALNTNDGAEIFGGNRIPEGAKPLAQAYAGHQFGHFTMLGDGRAILLGEQITPQGERFDIQLKGPGRTPYSRGGDGRAALGPMLREYIISEAMNGLGIPTTRSLAVVTTGRPVIRETQQSGAILTRVAASHLRVGTFQYAAKWGTIEELKELADYTLERHYPDYKTAENPYIYLIREVIKRQANLIAKWQLVGFIHGVMNTDNMTISAETIDYGPCAFMDTYDPATVFSSIDRQGRYAYGNQPSIAQWNLARFAETLLPLLHEDHQEAVKLAENEVAGFWEYYHHNWLAGMRSKLGLFTEEEEDEILIEELLTIMEKYGVDFTNTFRGLTFNELKDNKISETPEFTKWHEKWQVRLSRQPQSKEEVHQLMKNANPAIIPRNHRVEEALATAVDKGDYSVMKKLVEALSKPFAHTPDQEVYTTLPEASGCRYQTYCGT